MFAFNPTVWKTAAAGRKGGDARITCLSCHDPHQPLAMDPASYDSACLKCHRAAGAAGGAGSGVATGTTTGAATGAGTGAGKSADGDRRTACPIGVKLCVTCHMPRFENPLLHAVFTDHWIRITPSGAVLPD